MKLFTTIISERGKPVTKSGNEFISVTITGEDRENILQLNIFFEEETQQFVVTYVPLQTHYLENGTKAKTIRYNLH